MPKKPDSTEVLEPRFAKPIEGYRKIKCALGSGQLPDPCFKVCSGCPCLNREKGKPKMKLR